MLSALSHLIVIFRSGFLSSLIEYRLLETVWLRVVILFGIGILAIASRLFSVIRFGTLLHRQPRVHFTRLYGPTSNLQRLRMNTNRECYSRI
jgi:hypothetical protein